MLLLPLGGGYRLLLDCYCVPVGSLLLFPLDQPPVACDVFDEVYILKLIRHQNVVQLYEIIETSRQLYLIMEFAHAPRTGRRIQGTKAARGIG